MVLEWRDDYAAFEQWCFDHGYKPGLRIQKTSGGLLGPGNCRVITHKDEAPKEYIPVAGYSHRPCLDCDQAEDESMCTNVTRCSRYLAHWDETMRACRVNTGLEAAL